MFRNCKIRPRDLHRGMGEGEVEPKVSGQVLALCHCVHGTLRLCVSVCCLPHAVALTEKAAKHRASISGLADSLAPHHSCARPLHCLHPGLHLYIP